jgi:hypothetical protein
MDGTSGTHERRGKPPKDWSEKFLKALAETGNVWASCRQAKVSRTTVYRRREEDAAFAAAWLDALEDSSDVLEFEARRRAHDGVDEPVIYQGELCGRWIGPDGQEATKDTPGARMVPLVVKKYSDSLLTLLLKANRPGKFRDNSRVEHTSPPGSPMRLEHGASGGFFDCVRQTAAALAELRGENLAGRDPDAVGPPQPVDTGGPPPA